MTESTIRWEKGADNIVILTLDDPQQSANTMNARYTKSMHDTVERLEKERAFCVSSEKDDALEIVSALYQVIKH